MTFSLSRTTVEVSHVAAGEHMVRGHFIIGTFFLEKNGCTLNILRI
jgi:hypothetical protein